MSEGREGRAEYNSSTSKWEVIAMKNGNEVSRVNARHQADARELASYYAQTGILDDSGNESNG
tara:strand:- start:270 stop:458 length:189 start_codon:yes stop_codon:yes gene_type:complete